VNFATGLTRQLDISRANVGGAISDEDDF